MTTVNNEKRAYRLSGTTSLLGSCPANPEVYSSYVGKKAADAKKAYEEEMMLPSEEELEEQLRDIRQQGLTVFLRNGRGQFCLSQHVVKGFFKGAIATLKDQLGIAGVKGKVDNLIFISPEYIPIMRDGAPVTEADGYNERPLRADTMQGPRVTLSASEEIDAPWAIEVEISLIDNSGTGKSRAVDFEAIETALSYGEFKGLGQWRNGGHGSFKWERIR